MIRLALGQAVAEIDPRGAELKRWSVGGRELIWTPDPAVWPATAPILFPVVGWTRNGGIEVDGRRYPLGLHGFARTMPFRVTEQWPTHARLELRSDEATRALYPFDWTLEVRYTLEESGLETVLEVRNRGATPMPYACGLHPGFCWPLDDGAPDEHAIVFAERELAQVPIISPDGLFTRQTRRVPLDGRRLKLSAALLEREALCFLDAKSRSLRLAAPSGAAVDVALDNFPHLALWARPPAPFLSIEAWTGHGDYVDADGDLFAKPSMCHLAPGASGCHAAKFSFAAPHLLFRPERLAGSGKPDR